MPYSGQHPNDKQIAHVSLGIYVFVITFWVLIILFIFYTQLSFPICRLLGTDNAFGFLQPTFFPICRLLGTDNAFGFPHPTFFPICRLWGADNTFGFLHPFYIKILGILNKNNGQMGVL